MYNHGKPMSQHGEAYLLPLASDDSNKINYAYAFKLILNREASPGEKFSTLKLKKKKKKIL
jgi:hypothetical protein